MGKCSALRVAERLHVLRAGVNIPNQVPIDPDDLSSYLKRG
jgi:hypothetical protein